MAISAGKIYGCTFFTHEDHTRINPTAIQRVEECGFRVNVISCMSTGTHTSKAKESRYFFRLCLFFSFKFLNCCRFLF